MVDDKVGGGWMCDVECFSSQKFEIAKSEARSETVLDPKGDCKKSAPRHARNSSELQPKHHQELLLLNHHFTTTQSQHHH